MGDWLYRQVKFHTTDSIHKDQSIQFVKTWSLGHIKKKLIWDVMANRFTVSESGALGISCDENPSLSVMYPDTDKPPVILSNDTIYRSATFVKFRGKEHLAAACLDDGCLHLWDIESETYRNVFDPKYPKEKKRKDMNICMIDESTIGYGEAPPSLDGLRSVFILKINTTEEWTLSGTMELLVPDDIRDMCYMETEDGSPCLLLCLPYDKRIMAVEMEDGKARWELGKEQMGEKFDPLSICTDQNNCAYVADYRQHEIHLLSASDGTLIKRFDVGSQYGIVNIFAVRFYNQHLYIEHVVKDRDRYAIVKFEQIKKM